MSFQIHDVLSFAAVGQLTLITLFLLSYRKGNRISNTILAVFLFSKCLGIVNYLIFRFQINNPHFYFVFIPFSFLWGPALYFYVKSLTLRRFHFHKNDAWHLLPFFMGWGYFSWIYHFRNTAEKFQILARNMQTNSIGEIVITATLHITIAFYLGLAIFALKGYRENLKDIYSSVQEKNLPWLNLVLFGFLVIWACDVIGFGLNLSGISRISLIGLTMLLVFIFSNVIVFKGLHQPEIFAGLETNTKYARSPLTQKEKKQYLEKLLMYMEEEKPFLRSSLTITELGRKVTISPRYISQVINESLGLNFFDFVNEYRVQEAKRFLSKASSNHRNILDVLFDSGFNTKSVFNRVFKKHTGMTPSEFKHSIGN